VVRAPVAILALEAGMMDFGALWLRSQIRTGETVLALRQAGHNWREITDTLHLGHVDDARRCAALFLSADLASREAAQEGTGRAQPRPAADGCPAGERVAGAAG
jgi:hypothetical protein